MIGSAGGGWRFYLTYIHIKDIGREQRLNEFPTKVTKIIIVIVVIIIIIIIMIIIMIKIMKIIMI